MQLIDYFLMAIFTNNMLVEMVIAAVIIAITVVIHAVALGRLILLLEWFAPFAVKTLCNHPIPMGWKTMTTVVAASGVMTAIILEIWVWALFFIAVDEPAIQTMEAALYFATSSFTTLGFGDIVLSEEWRLIGSFAAANGMVIFGWSTAFLYEIIHNVYVNDHIRPE